MDVVMDTVRHWRENYEWALTKSDPRVADWFLMDSYTPTIVLTIAYIIIVNVGPHLMKNREPFHFPNVLFFYNMFLVAVNFHIFKELVIGVYQANYSWTCQPVEYSNDPAELRIAAALWWFYFSKLLEFMDTFFFVLRKKNNQISFLHVYHHATMFPIWWIGIKWVAGGQSFFGAMINSFIHVLMYGYYGVSALGPHMQKYLWWKRYLTRLQLIQFFICLIKVTHSMLTGCPFPMWMQWVSVFYGTSLVLLFSNFYYQAYVKSRAARREAKIQFVAGGTHAFQSVVRDCDFPRWMQWALVVYASTIMALFMNFYFHAYVKAKAAKASKDSNGHVSNGAATNGAANGKVENKKSK